MRDFKLWSTIQKLIPWILLLLKFNDGNNKIHPKRNIAQGSAPFPLGACESSKCFASPPPSSFSSSPWYQTQLAAAAAEALVIVAPVSSVPPMVLLHIFGVSPPFTPHNRWDWGVIDSSRPRPRGVGWGRGWEGWFMFYPPFPFFARSVCSFRFLSLAAGWVQTEECVVLRDGKLAFKWDRGRDSVGIMIMFFLWAEILCRRSYQFI